MADLRTSYLGLELANPILVASSGMTGSIDGVRRCADAGAGAVVLKSIFEEQIAHEVEGLYPPGDPAMVHPEAYDYITAYGRDHAVDHYLNLVEQSRALAGIPVIASIHCVSAGAWTEFAARIEDAGAHALELNVYLPPTRMTQTAAELETTYFEIARSVKRRVGIPVSLKVGSHFTALAGFLSGLSREADGLVLFNRYHRMDFDIDRVEIIGGAIHSLEHEMQVPLRWISILAGHVHGDLAATTGFHDGAAVVKALLAGASTVQVASALYRHGLGHLGRMRDELAAWMDAHGFARIDEFKGMLSRARTRTPDAYERVQFMKTSVGIE